MKNMRFPFSAYIICAILFCSSLAHGQLENALNGVYAGSTEKPVTFTISSDCNNDGKQITFFWDFGAGATPAQAVTPFIFDIGTSRVLNRDVMYSTPGDKKFTVTTDQSGIINTFALHIYDCSVPAIPRDAIVIKSDTTVARSSQVPSRAYWVNPGVTLNLNAAGNDTIFAEAGSTITGAYESVLYMKHGSVLHTANGYMNSVIYGDGASMNSDPQEFTLHCPTLDFDYTNAPPNAAHPLDGVVSASLPSISISPNPTRGIISIQGAPSNELNITVLNLLGETMMQLKNSHTSDFTLDLSKLVSGTYYIRFSSANSVVTKMVVRE